MDLFDHAKKLAETIISRGSLRIISHLDADGIASSGILCSALERLGIDYRIEFVRRVERSLLEKIEKDELVIFLELGSGNLDFLHEKNFEWVVIDHHQPSGKICWRVFNPNIFGIDGTMELSGSGTAFLLALAMDGNNQDLADLAVVGAAGDLQDRNGLQGINRKILEIGKRKGIVFPEIDLRLFGRQTKPVFKLLEKLLPSPGSFLDSIGIDAWKKWIDLSFDGRRKVISNLLKLCIFDGIPSERIIGEVYTLRRELPGTELRDAREYATLLNVTARCNSGDIGLRICMGDRNASYRKAKSLRREYRKNLMDGFHLVKEEITDFKTFRYFHSPIKEEIVGVVTTMLSEFFPDKPLLGIAPVESELKISARFSGGKNLGFILRYAAQKVGGEGGGHRTAAGAMIPEGCMEEFLIFLQRLLS
jgi:RecJ-like exonuclease